MTSRVIGSQCTRTGGTDSEISCEPSEPQIEWAKGKPRDFAYMMRKHGGAEKVVVRAQSLRDGAAAELV